MKRLCILLLAFSVFMFACEENAEVTTEADTSVTSAIESDICDIPFVVSADSYSKDVIDTLGYGGLDFKHNVEYPKIESDAPGAVALNEKIKEKYGKIIDKLKSNAEEGELYSIGYAYSVSENVIFIKMSEMLGWQYSEWFDDQALYYYDVKNDKELTADEYIRLFGIDIEKAKDNALYSYELAYSGFGVDGADGGMREEIGDTPCYAPAPDRLYYLKSGGYEESVEFDGAEINGDKLILYFTGNMYTQTSFSCELDRATLLPISPNYAGYVMPDAYPANADSIKILWNEKEASSVSYSKKLPIYAVNVYSDNITVLSSDNLDGITVTVNGDTLSCVSQEYNPEANTYSYLYVFKDYIPVDDLKTIEITK